MRQVVGKNEATMDLEADHRLAGHQIVAVHKVGTLHGKLLGSLLDLLDLTEQMEQVELAEQVLDSFAPVVPITVLVELTFVQMPEQDLTELLQVLS